MWFFPKTADPKLDNTSYSATLEQLLAYNFPISKDEQIILELKPLCYNLKSHRLDNEQETGLPSGPFGSQVQRVPKEKSLVFFMVTLLVAFLCTILEKRYLSKIIIINLNNSNSKSCCWLQTKDEMLYINQSTLKKLYMLMLSPCEAKLQKLYQPYTTNVQGQFQ